MLTQLLTDTLRQAIVDHAGAEQPRECCGLLVRDPDGGTLHYMAARNTLAGRDAEERFVMDPADYAAAADFGELVAVVHSHPNASANPSMADRVRCEDSGLPWLVVGWPSGVMKEISPEGWQAPYVGRDFSYGVLDCYTLIQDWYRRELGITLVDHDTEDGWWLKGQDQYMQNFERAGFVRAPGPAQRHDVLLMRVAAPVANHGAVYMGDGVMLHHLHGRPSSRDVYGGYWARNLAAVLRHRSQL